MFRKILIANRGEIAARIMRTVREMGIRAATVYSEADRRALHVFEADDAVCIGPADPRASYLDIDRVVNAALETGSDAVHPGYGFLAENPSFARAVKDAGLTFIGPPAQVMADLGDKTTARRIMEQGGVPIIPGMTEASTDMDRLKHTAASLGYPVLVKAAAGGGGKGMRIVQQESELASAVENAAGEALGAFGDGAVYIEKFLDRPRHVEFQILADAHGAVVHLFERECSIQRRHQKIIEETPSLALDPALRAAMGEAAKAAAKAAGYVNAGTVEFLLDREGRFYFLEVNTRLQVEHPVTELTLGMDLVRRQIEIAAGLPLPFRQEDISPRGVAIECRIYAEDPASGFIPSPGKVLLARSPEGPGVRYDHAVYSGCEVPVHYDPILGKLAVWAEDRPAACERMIRALKDCVILGVKTPIEFLIDVISSDAFRKGEIHTGFIEEHFGDWRPSPEADRDAALGYVLADMIGIGAGTHGDPTINPTRSEIRSPWMTIGAWDMMR
jgi:acetyl-CoA carboxylase biotin carboxylase subunit